MARSVVTVAEYPNAMLAEIARGRLEEEGIQAEVSGAMAQTWAGGDVPFLGVRVEVLREDADRALAVLEAIEAGENAPDDDAEESLPASLMDGDESEPDALAEDGAIDAKEPEHEDHPERWSLDRTRRAIRDALVVTMLSWIWLPLVPVALVLGIRVLLHQGAKRWTPGMRTAFAVTAILILALMAYSLYVVLTDPLYWFMPWPWFQGTPLPALPEE